MERMIKIEQLKSILKYKYSYKPLSEGLTTKYIIKSTVIASKTINVNTQKYLNLMLYLREKGFELKSPNPLTI